jgi:16S rRNA (cytosine1402-N4)-methyltransferase
MKHYSVLLKESIEGLNIKADGIYVDGTLGYGGHSSEILKKLSKAGHLFSFDQDREAIDYAKERLSKINNNFTIIDSNFVNLKERLNECGVNKVDGIIFDLGLSSPQIDNVDRGFSYMNRDAILDMRMDTRTKLTAEDIVNNYSEDELSDVFFSYGEEKMSRSIARKILEVRSSKRIKTAGDLEDIIASATGMKYFNLNHPDRQIFQAIRIEVNNELNVLKKVLPDAIQMLNKGGRIVVITFHSLEDRIVKKTFKELSEINEFYKGLPEKDIPKEFQPKIMLVNKKPILPSEEELEENSRSKSAKLRIAERV